MIGAAVLASSVARTQGFSEGNKRTALLLARWLLEPNGEEAARFFPAEDRVVGALLVDAAAGRDVEARMIEVLTSRRAG